MECKFRISWVGICKEPADETGYCEKHKAMKCCSCGEQATHDCEETGQFVCGYPLCDSCEHTIVEEGTNGGIGFFRSCKLPEGLGLHCKKTDQVFKPWYMRKKEEQAGLST